MAIHIDGETRRFSPRLQSHKPSYDSADAAVAAVPRVRIRSSRPLDVYAAPVLRLYNQDAAASLSKHSDMRVSVHVAAPAKRNVVLRNIAGILRGSDPALASQALSSAPITITWARNRPDRATIFNGANDNGSGVVSVTEEIAAALATLNPHPHRTILFITFFGEEEGLFGSYYYVRHPIIPLKDTVANINLEADGPHRRHRWLRKSEPSLLQDRLTSDLPALISSARSLSSWP